MLEFQASKEKHQFACRGCGVSDYRILHWHVDRWLCENCKAKQKHSLAVETQLVAASKQQNKSKEF